MKDATIGDERSRVRREDRAVVDDEWIRDILRFEPYATVATAKGNQPFVRPSAFFFDDEQNAIYIHGAHQGRGFENLADNPSVCLSVYVVGAMRGHARAFEFFLEQGGVIVFGYASRVEDDPTKHRVMQALFEKHAPHLENGVDYEPASQEEIDLTTVYRIDIEEWSGKIKWTDDEPLFRFNYEDVRGERRAALPWNRSDMDPLTTEWQSSRH
ncbi:MAG: pyridoxamine 5'-phosphate oxidase family protein [Actinomycetota bacterium]|nr:pyridoxamine 5'-phosphate oxidase family protein [Actinomycetota bacterium]